MKHIFVKGASESTLILLHGTGGNEHDLLSLGKEVFPQANLLGIRGNVLEGNMPRFFKRLGMGVFDLDSYENETVELKKFIDEAVKQYGLNTEKVWIMGYSNGANIAINLFDKYPNAFKGMALLHAMLIKNLECEEKQTTKMLLTVGINDPIIAFDQSQLLAQQLKERANDFVMKTYIHGHGISNQEVEDVKEWFLNKK